MFLEGMRASARVLQANGRRIGYVHVWSYAGYAYQEALERLLEALPRCLKPGGRAVVISFHSLEDRHVKQAFRDRAVWKGLTPKPVQAGAEELTHNPRARSAKLRAACLLETGETHDDA